MSLLNAFLKKISWRVFGRVSSDVLAFVFYAILARVFGASQMGDYASAFAIANLVGFGIELGLRPLLTREVAKERSAARLYLGNLLITQTALTVIIGVALTAAVLVFDFSGEIYPLLMIAYFAIAIKSIGLTFIACLEAVEEMTKVAVLEIAERVVIMLIGFALLLANQTMQVVMIAYVVSAVVYLGLSMYWSRQAFGPFEFKIDRPLITNVVIASLPFLGASALNVLYSRVDVLMLYSFVGKAETGAYSIAYRCVESALIVALMAGVIIYPALSRSQVGDSGKTELLFQVTVKWLGILGAIGAVMMIAVGDVLLVLIFGDKYEYSGEILRYMAVLFLLGCVKVPYWRLLFAVHREYIQLLLQVVSIATNLILNVILIPRYGAPGAVAASTISEIILFGSFHWYCTRRLDVSLAGGVLALIFSTTLAMAVALWLRGFAAWPFVGAATLVVFFAATLLTGVISADERTTIAGILRSTAARFGTLIRLRS